MITRVTRFLGILMLIAAFGVMLAACGGDSGSASSSTASSGSSGGAGTTVMIKETKGADGKDQYMFDQTTLTVKAGDSVTFQNMSDENQAITGDGGVNVTVPVNKTGATTFKDAGTFKISTDKGATMTVTVQ